MKHLLMTLVLCSASLLGANDKRNVQLFIFDDYGAVSAQSYQDIFSTKRVAPTANFNNICEKGIRFTHVWANPTCSPTRTNILTGRYSFRTGVGRPCQNGVNEIRPDEPTLPRLIEQFDPSYRSLNVGKWHLGYSQDKEGALAPNFMGWDYFSGILTGFLSDYYSWNQIENGVSRRTSVYATTKNIDDALNYIQVSNQDASYFAWVAFNAPHTPLHLPPDHLHSYQHLSSSTTAIQRDPISYFEAMVEATDTEMGRLLSSFEDSNHDGIPDNTLVIAMGDNGTMNSVRNNLIPEPFAKAKGKMTLFEHGVRVPLCIAGDMIKDGGRDVTAPVNVADLYRTILDYIGVPAFVLPADQFNFDSISLTPYLENPNAAPQRDWIYSEQFGSSGGASQSNGAAISDTVYRFMKFESNNQEACYHIINDPLENNDLLNSGSAQDLRSCDQLKTTMLNLVCSERESYWFDRWCS